MKNSLRRLRRSGAAVLGTGLVLTGCGAPPAENNGSGTKSVSYLACIVSDAGGFDDRSFNQSSYEGLVKAKNDLGIQMKQAESKAETDFTPNVDSMMAAGCNLTFTVGFLIADTTKAAAQANPGKDFAIIDDNSINLPNVKPIIYDTAQAAFLAGYLAAGMTKTGKVGTYGGLNIPTVTIFMDGYADGVAYYNQQKKTDVKVLGWNTADRTTGAFAGGFDGANLGRQQAQNLIGEGADIILPVAGPVGLGTLDEVIAQNQAGRDIKVIWVDSDGYETAGKGQKYILTSVMKLMGQAVETVVKDGVDGKFTSTPYVGTLDNGGVALAPFHDLDSAVPATLKSELDTLKADIIAGKIKIDSPSSPKTASPTPGS